MPTYIRPARVDVHEGGGGVLVLAAAALAAGALVAFILAHLILIAVAAGVLAAAPLALALAMRRFIQPHGVRQWHREQELSARRVPLAIPAPPKAIEGATVVEGSVVTSNKTAGKLEVVTPAAVRQARR